MSGREGGSDPLRSASVVRAKTALIVIILCPPGRFGATQYGSYKIMSAQTSLNGTVSRFHPNFVLHLAAMHKC